MAKRGYLIAICEMCKKSSCFLRGHDLGETANKISLICFGEMGKSVCCYTKEVMISVKPPTNEDYQIEYGKILKCVTLQSSHGLNETTYM